MPVTSTKGACFLDFNEKLLPRYRRFAREFFGTPGANVPGVMSLAGDPLTGWAQYSLSPTAGAWVAHLFYLHWRYTGDDRYLREVAYPWCREVGQCLRALLRSDAQGVLRLPLSSSPEIHDNSLKAWLAPNSNYDLFCMKMLFLSLSEMADAAGETAEASQWTELAAALGPYHVDAQGMLLIDATKPLPASHRHLSNLMGLYPFNLVTCEGRRARSNHDQGQPRPVGPSRHQGLVRLLVLVDVGPARPRGRPGGSGPQSRHLREGLPPAQRLPRQRRPDEERLQRLHLPAVHARGQHAGRRRPCTRCSCRAGAPRPAGATPR